MKLTMFPARAHHTVLRVKMIIQMTKRGLRPSASDRRPSSGWKAVDVSIKAVDSQEAEFAEWKSDVMTGCDEAMIVPSNAVINKLSNKTEKMHQNLPGSVSIKNFIGGGSSSGCCPRLPSKGELSSLPSTLLTPTLPFLFPPVKGPTIPL